MPPDPIHDVLSGVLRVMGNTDASWSSMKKFLAQPGVIERILNFDVRQISDEIRTDVEKLLKDKSNSFEHSVIYRVSVAAAPLAKWVHAVIKYSKVLIKIQPMEQKQAAAEAKLVEATTRLGECREQLAEIDAQVVELQKEFEDRTRVAEVLDS